MDSGVWLDGDDVATDEDERESSDVVTSAPSTAQVLGSSREPFADPSPAVAFEAGDSNANPTESPTDVANPTEPPMPEVNATGGSAIAPQLSDAQSPSGGATSEKPDRPARLDPSKTDSAHSEFNDVSAPPVASGLDEELALLAAKPRVPRWLLPAALGVAVVVTAAIAISDLGAEPAHPAARIEPESPAVVSPVPSPALASQGTATQDSAAEAPPAAPEPEEATSNRVIVRSSPRGAILFRDKKRLGQGRVELQLEEGETARILAVLHGHQPTWITLDGSNPEVVIALTPAASTPGTLATKERASSGATKPRSAEAAFFREMNEID